MLAWLRHSKSKRPVIVVYMLFERETGLLLLGMATYKYGENTILLILRDACKHCIYLN